ncbi:NUDIX domain-containing protein [Pseudozobellia sp. WGM2]|uniref:NUDIX hydrolase n=1 Tax=Pseudozobellia sp. WGM2 TaxID=2787625 RepID=UPI001AE01644
MIFKKRTYTADKKVNPFIGALLFLISIVLILVTGPLGFVYGILHTFVTKGIRGIGEFFLKIAISVDQLGNVLMQHLLNVLWMKRGGYKFGNRDETISSALGRNKKLGTLTWQGRLIDKILDIIDPNHSLNSIDYYIEPSQNIIDKLAWIHIVDGKILVARNRGRDKFYIPGGKREIGESDAQTLFREIQEELSVEIELATMQFIGIFEAQADSHKPGVLVRMTCYSALYRGNLVPASEIEEMAWLNYDDSEKVSEVDTLIFDVLKENGKLI